MEKDFIELYKSGKLPFEKFDEYTKTLIKTSNEMHTKKKQSKQFQVTPLKTWNI